MEIRERYDPEDIEHLLLERGFDELLEEERAYVLRHLSGRAEYEQMRMLLLSVRHDDRDERAGDADPVVRENVMAAFRAQQRPAFGIWLNSVKAFLWPANVSDLWKPALAFASLALVVTVTLLGIRNEALHTEGGLAEIRKEEVVQPKAPLLEQKVAEQPSSTLVVEREDKATLQDEAERASEAPVTGTGSANAVAEDLQMHNTAPAEADQSDAKDLFVQGSRDFDSAVPAAVQPTVTHLVDAADLATNVSRAEVQVEEVTVASAGRSKHKAVGKYKKNEQQVPADDGALVGLLRAAW